MGVDPTMTYPDSQKDPDWVSAPDCGACGGSPCDGSHPDCGPENVKIDFRSVADRLARAHSKAAGDLHLSRLELDEARTVIVRLVDQICHMADAAHQAYHDFTCPDCDGSGQRDGRGVMSCVPCNGTGRRPPASWRQCERPFCKDAVSLLTELAKGRIRP